jgi:hypothetical protein
MEQPDSGLVPELQKRGLAVFADEIELAIQHAGFKTERRSLVGQRASSSRPYFVDLRALSGRRIVLVSAKWQETRGSTETKVPWEAMCMDHIVRTGDNVSGYIVLGGTGWTLDDYFVDGGLARDLRLDARTTILRDTDFLARARAGAL